MNRTGISSYHEKPVERNQKTLKTENINQYFKNSTSPQNLGHKTFYRHSTLSKTTVNPLYFLQVFIIQQ